VRNVNCELIFGELSWNISSFNYCWSELAISERLETSPNEPASHMFAFASIVHEPNK
jgi:hypothetical protein